MQMYNLIQKKKNGMALTKDEIDYIIQGFTREEIPDYQMSAFLMAVYFKGMNEEETVSLTTAMANSGEIMDLSCIEGCIVDKHSTGGVGDKTSLVLAPMVAACGIPVAKLSGRGLGYTGGTIDKLESFPGFTSELSSSEFINNVNKIKMSIISQSQDIAPADKKIYALRDVTATVDNISLIASSIMSKKIASGADAIVLDVKTGSGAFMEEEKDAIELAQEMVKIGTGAGKKTLAIISDMDQPLGNAVGNTLEVKEAIDILDGKLENDVLELCLVLGSYMLVSAEKTEDIDEARVMLKKTIQDKSALNKLAEFIKLQGGDNSGIYNTELLAKASIVMELLSTYNGFIEKIDAAEVGIVNLLLGGGRETKDSTIDLTVGIVLNKKVGDKVEKDEVIATIYANDIEKLKIASDRLMNAYTFSVTPAKKRPLIKWIVTKNGAKRY
jgi:pyrimidine-nucleoside phosphorylase